MFGAQLKRAVVSLIRKTATNQEMRIKHPDEPARFLDSEVPFAGAQCHALASLSPAQPGRVCSIRTCVFQKNVEIPVPGAPAPQHPAYLKRLFFCVKQALPGTASARTERATVAYHAGAGGAPLCLHPPHWH